MSPASQIHAKISGPIVMIGFGSIGKGTLPLIERHFAYDKARLVVIDPDDSDRGLLDKRGVRFIDTVVEPWAGFYFDAKLGPEARSNYALRETVLAARRRKPGGPTAV